jgi:hypothetical protein
MKRNSAHSMRCLCITLCIPCCVFLTSCVPFGIFAIHSAAPQNSTEQALDIYLALACFLPAILFAFLSSSLAQRKGRNPWVWSILSLFFSFLSYCVLYNLDDLSQPIEKEPSADSEMSYNHAKKGNDMQNIPSINTIPQTVRAIVAFMPDLAAAQKVANNLPDASILRAPLKVTGGATKQGRHMIQIEGDIPKNLAIPLLQNIDDLGGDIQVIAG